MNKILQDYYYDPETGFVTAAKLYKTLRKDGIKVTQEQVKAFVEKQFTRQVTKALKKPTVYQTIISPATNNNYQIDLLIYDRYEYNNYKYILCCIDVYSRYAQCKALTNREFPNIMSKLKEIFEVMGKPKNINVDGEFNTKEFNKYCSDNEINVYYSEPDQTNKNAIVERFNRSLAELLQRWRQGTNKYNWYSVLPKIVNNYNNTIHRTTKHTPKSIFNGKEFNEQTIIRDVDKLQVGDKVRKKIIKKIFDKNDVIKYSKTLYTISRIDKNKYYLIDEDGNETDKHSKVYELAKIDEVENIPIKSDEADIHFINKKIKKINKEMKKAGVETENIKTTKRNKKVIKNDDYEYY